MENKQNISQLMREAMGKVREMVDANTIIGEPINTPDGVILIPISKVSFGFGGGGVDFGGKKQETAQNFGAGLGVGVKVAPVAFLIIKDGAVRVLPVNIPVSTVDRVVDMVPDIIDKVTSLFPKKEEETH